jgi:hypothetical protein
MYINTATLYRVAVKGIPICALAALPALAGCSETNLVRDTFVAVGAGPKLAESPGFVQESRPAALDYVPVGTSAPGRPTAAKTAEEVKSAEAEMDAVRARNEAAAAEVRQAGQATSENPAKAPAAAKR